MKSNLPEGWVEVTVGEISRKIHYGYTASSTQNDTGFKMLRITDIQDSHVEWNDVPFCEISEKDASKYLLEEGDLVFARTGATVGKSFLINGAIPPAVFASYLIRVQLHEEISQQLIAYFFNSPLYWNQIAANSRGIGQPNVNASVLSTLKLPLPPIAEQHRLVAHLNEAMRKLEATQERLEKLPELLKKFRQAVLAAAVSGKLTEAWRAEQPQGETGADLLDRIRAERRAQWEDKQRAKLSGKQLSLNDDWKKKYEEPAAPDASELPELPEGWTWAAVEQLAKVGTGATPLKSNSNYYEGGSIPWVTSGALNNLFIRAAEDHITPLAVAETNAKVFPIGTLLVALYGEGKTRGKVSELAIEAATNQACAAIVFDLAATSVRDFVKLFFQKNYDDLRKLAAGGVQPNLNLGLIKTTCVPFPPLDEQQEIVRQVNHYFELADQLEARLEQAAALVEQLPQALLAKAFSGQLVPQDPNDEPASALLERLEAEVAAPIKGKRGRKPKAMADAPLFE